MAICLLQFLLSLLSCVGSPGLNLLDSFRCMPKIDRRYDKIRCTGPVYSVDSLNLILQLARSSEIDANFSLNGGGDWLRFVDRKRAFTSSSRGR